ncbi:hypothetical protein D9619_003210 [Psilocybe cf. subviscida]|uniref:Uncharacterized protein n=1 Tax=Psilocybe cf. subviscida TaxID=2480587 RepID=A0A8H5AX93_9AGAR|nr:hypothetical protein D9619_003210 [Psilocybe cf. subviscida]
MFILRTEVDGCPAGRVSCSTTSNDPSPSTTYDTVPGVHRFIGIGMVIVMAFMVLIGWLYWANYPRRKFPFLYRWGRRSRGQGANDVENIDVYDSTQSTIVVADSSSSGKLKEIISVGSLQQHSRRVDDDDDDKTKCDMSVDAATVGASSRKPRRPAPRKQHRKQRPGQGQRRVRDDKRPTREERARALEKTRNRMLQAEPGGMVKQVSGGMVMYTKPPRTPAPAVMRQARERSRHPQQQQQQPVAADWQFEHVHGVRFELCGPGSSFRSPFRAEDEASMHSFAHICTRLWRCVSYCAHSSGMEALAFALGTVTNAPQNRGRIIEHQSAINNEIVEEIQ